jgi:hypothetical protein
VEPQPRALRAWLPAQRQVADALAGRVTAAIGPDPTGVPFRHGVHTSMRQGMGLILLVGALAALPALVVNWIGAAQMHTIVPIARLLQWVERWPMEGPLYRLADDTVRSLAGLQPNAPPWAAAGLSALGVWVNAPLRLLSWWIVYGLAVLVVAKLLGAGTTLPRFYGATAYAALPLLLTALAPLPWVGGAFVLVGWLWAVVLYSMAVRAATESSWGRAIFASLLPGLFLIAVAAIYGGAAWRWLV